MKLTKKGVIIGICIFLCVVFVTAALNDPYPWFGYDEEWMIGKTAAQIQERYGEFDDTFEPVDGAIVCGTYRLSDSDYGKDYYDWKDRVKIYFDKSGTAIFVSLQQFQHLHTALQGRQFSFFQKLTDHKHTSNGIYPFHY